MPSKPTPPFPPPPQDDHAADLLRLGMLCHAPPSPPVVPGYQILETLDRGGMGVVYLANQKNLGRQVALKVLRHDLHPSGWEPERLEREARTMAALNAPNLVTVHDCIRLGDGSVAIAMEFVGSGNLRERIGSAPDGLPLPDAARWFNDIAAGLSAAHSAGIIHRDIKPENILIDSNDTAKIADFGLADPQPANSWHPSASSLARGTAGYMSPEQLCGEPADARSDIFSLGVVFYEMLTGRLPQGNFPNPRQQRPALPPKIDHLVLQALDPDPRKRPTIMSVCDVLDSLSRDQPAGLKRRAVVVATTALATISATGWGIHNLTSSRPKWIAVPWPKDPTGSAIAGTWTREGEAIVSSDEIAILPVRDQLPSAWSLRLRFTRLAGENSIALFFRTPLGFGEFTLGAWRQNLGGVQLVAGQSLQQRGGFTFPVENARPYEWIVSFVDGRTTTSVDGHLLDRREIFGQPLSVPSPWQWSPGPATPALLIGSWNSPTRFTSLELQPIESSPDL